MVVGAALLVGALAVQPAFVSRDPNRQSEFAWEMYTKGAPKDEFEVVSASRTERITVLDVQPRGLATVDYTPVLPDFICERRPETVEVLVFRADALIGARRCP